MRLYRVFLLAAILPMAFGTLPAARAQMSEEALENQITAAKVMLANGNGDEQERALGQLVQLSLPPTQGVPLFHAHLRRRTRSSVEALAIRHAVEGLAQYGPDARQALPDLIRLLDEVGTVQGDSANGGQIEWWLTTALSKIGPDDPDTVEALKRTLRRCLASPHRLGTLLEETAQALSHMGRTAHSAAPLLTLALSTSPDSTPQLASSLSHLMPEAALSIPALIRALEANRSPEAVAEALGTMGPAAKSALPALHRALERPSPRLPCLAFAAIAHIEGLPKLTVSESSSVLRQMDTRRLPAIYAAFATIQVHGVKAGEAVPVLTQIVEQRSEPWLRRTAIQTLASVGPASSREAAVLLVRAAQGHDPVIALDADKAFEEFNSPSGSAAEKVIPELSALLDTTDEHLWDRLQSMLYPLGDRAAPAVPVLVRLLKTDIPGKPSASHASDILFLLGKIGGAAQGAVPVLTDLLLKSENPTNGAPVFGRIVLLTTLMKIGVTPRILPTVREMLQSPHPTQVACAAHAVALLGPKAVDTIPLLLLSLRPDYKDRSMTKDFTYGYTYDTSARIESMRALASFGSAAREALPLLQAFADFPENIPGRQYRQLVLKQEAQQAIQAIQQTKG